MILLGFEHARDTSRLAMRRWLLGALLLLASCRSRPAPPKPYLAFVANRQSETVAAVDLATLRVVASIPVAGGPERVLARPGSHEVYVTTASGSVSIIAFPELRVIATIRFASRCGTRGASQAGVETQPTPPGGPEEPEGPKENEPCDLVFSAEGRRAYALAASEGQIVFLDCNGRKEVARLKVDPEASRLALTPDGKTLIVAERYRNTLTFVDVEARKVLGSVRVGQEPGSMAIRPAASPESSKVFVADTGEKKISVVDIATRELLSHIETGAKPSTLTLKPDGGEVFALSALGAALTIVDAFHDDVEETIPTGHQPVAALFRRDSTVVYLANAGDGAVAAFDVQNRTLLASTHVGTEPRALALTPDERFLLAVDSAAGSLAVLRLEEKVTPPRPLALLTTIPVGARPIDVIVPDWLWKM